MHSKEKTMPMIKLRPVEFTDSKTIWEWANEPTTRSVSFSPEPIPWEQHSRWFSEKLLDPHCLFFMVLGADDMPIGQVRYDTDGNEAVISVGLAADHRGQGYGSQAIQLASRHVFARTAIEAIHAYIKPDNSSSIRAFTRAGFIDCASIEVHGTVARHYILRR